MGRKPPPTTVDERIRQWAALRSPEGRAEMGRIRSAAAEAEYQARQRRWRSKWPDMSGGHLRLDEGYDHKSQFDLMNTPELTIEEWQASWVPENQPDDFEPPG